MQDNNQTMQMIADRINALHTDVGDLRDTMITSMKEMSQAVTKLAQVDERQIYMNQAYERLSNLIEKQQDKNDKLESRIDELEKQQPLIKQALNWIYTGVGAVVLTAAGFVAKMVGLM